MVSAYERVDCTGLIAQKLISSKLGSPIVRGRQSTDAQQRWSRKPKKDMEKQMHNGLDNVAYFF
jgi:hypothetical protein